MKQEPTLDDYKNALHNVSVVVEKMRYAMEHEIQDNYVLDLLDMFDEDTAEYKLFDILDHRHE